MSDLITRTGATWGPSFGAAGGTVSYSFAIGNQANSISVTASARDTFAQAFALIAEVADISFVYGGGGDFLSTDSSAGDIDITMLRSSGNGVGGVGGWGGIGRPGGATITNGSVEVYGENLSLYLHEVMHALGMSHPGDYDGRNATYATDAPYWDDTEQFTLMSYWTPNFTGGNYGRLSHDHLMIYDIAALQAAYGANMTTRTGDDIYGRGGIEIGAIWDAGGTDMIDLADALTAVEIDLREGGFSSFDGYTNNLAIAYGAVIENARAGSRDDLVILNGARNVADGGTGIDTASYRGAEAGVVATLRGTGTGGDAAGDVLSRFERLEGSRFDDVLSGSNGADRLIGGEGADVLVGGRGGDVLEGGDGRDTARYDTAVRADFVFRQTATGDASGDLFIGMENLAGSRFADALLADGGANRIEGGAGNDLLAGRNGNDILRGDAGADELRGGAGADTLIGGSERDAASYSDALAGVTVDMADRLANRGDAAGDRFTGIENLVGSGFADTLRGDDAPNLLNGQGGADVIVSRGGNDILRGDDGDDRLEGGAGNDSLIGGRGSDVLDGGAGRDTASYIDSVGAGVTADLANASLNRGDAAGDTFRSIENLAGSSAADVLRGNAGANRIDGFAGADVLEGRGGDDVLNGGGGADTFVFSAGFGADRVVGFQNGADRFDLSAVASGFDDLLIAQNGADAVIALDIDGNGLADGASSITLAGRDVGLLDASDFLFG